MPKLNLKDLEELRKQIKIRKTLGPDGQYSAKITVHMGTCGIASGARSIMNEFMILTEQSGRRDIFLTTSGCAGLCSHEPMATVELSGEIPVKYIDLTPEKTAEIFRNHVINLQPVQEFALAVGSERAI